MLAPASARPSSDRLKESLFSSLESRGLIEGRAALDLFAGSGALGLEALSRGAESCHFVDSDREAQEIIKKNLDSLGVPTQSARVLGQSALKFGSELAFGLVFIDPPYGDAALDRLLTRINKQIHLEPEATVVVETDSAEDLSAQKYLELIKDTKVGKSRFRIFSYQPEETEI